MDVESFVFFKYLALASTAAAVAAQSKDINGRRFRPIRFTCGVVFFAVVGFAFGLGMSRLTSDAGCVIAAVMATVLLKLLPEEIWGRSVKKRGETIDKKKK